MKYTKETKKRIRELYSSGTHTIKEICKTVGISQETWNDWKHNKPEFSELLKKAEKEKFDRLLVLAQGTLAKKLTGYDVEEITSEVRNIKVPVKETTVNDKGKVVTTETITFKQVKVLEKRTKKHIPASDILILATLFNRDPDNWKRNREKDNEEEPEDSVVILPDNGRNEQTEQG